MTSALIAVNLEGSLVVMRKTTTYFGTTYRDYLVHMYRHREMAMTDTNLVYS